MIRWAKARGIEVTAEVTPHHLLLTCDLLAGYDPVFKVNPPLRPDGDVAALRAGLADGTIDAVATDHAPHAAHDKEHAFGDAAFGMLGLQTALASSSRRWCTPVCSTGHGVADRMSCGRRAIGRLSGHGRPIDAGGAGEPDAGRPGRLRRSSTRLRWPPSRATRRSPVAPSRRAWSPRSCGGRATVLDGALRQRVPA